MPRQSRSALIATALVVLLTGCFGSLGSPTPGASASAPVSVPSPEPSEASASAPASAAPSEGTAGPFTCDLPVHVDATAPLANIVDVRSATHPGYDRVVFEFTGGIPEAILERASPPFSHDASGEPIEVEGATFLRLSLVGGTKQMPDGSSSYDGPTEFTTEYPTLVHLVEGGDFEARSTWYLGLSWVACVNVFTLQAEGDIGYRLVIDVEQ